MSKYFWPWEIIQHRVGNLIAGGIIDGSDTPENQKKLDEIDKQFRIALQEAYIWGVHDANIQEDRIAKRNRKRLIASLYASKNYSKTNPTTIHVRYSRRKRN